MKIVHLCLCGIVTDGFSYQDNLLSKYHVKLGHEVTIITSEWIYNNKGEVDRYNKCNYYNDDGVHMIRLKLSKDAKQSFKFKRYANLYSAISDELPEILFIHGCQFCDMNAIVRYLKTHSYVKVYVDNHADFSNSATNWLSKNVLHKMFWRHCAHIIEPFTIKFYGVLPVRVDFLKKIYRLPSEKCELLVMGADDERVEEAKKPEVRVSIRKQYGIMEDDFLIMTGGKIDPWKTQTLLLMEAVANIYNPQVKLIVFGSVTPDLREKLESLCVKDKILYIGWVKPEDSYKLFASSDLVVFPGRHSVFWEQVAGLSVPMICKYWDGTTHVDLGGNVVFLKKDSVEEIESALKEIVYDKSKYDSMCHIAKKGLEYFSYKNIAKQAIETSYRKLEII